MGRKKKKQSTPLSKHETSSQSALSAAASTLPVRIVKGSSKNAKSLIPHVVIAEMDAARLSIQAGDEVILLSAGGVVVGRAEISSGSSPGGSQHARSKQLNPGTIHVTHSSLINVLLSQEDNTKQSHTSLVTPPPSNQPPPTPSSDTSGFSFKVGGGGDQLYSPSPVKNTSSSPPKTPQQKSSNSECWIVPCSSRLGKCVVLDFCADADIVTVRVPSSIPSRATLMLQRLVWAHTVGRYIQPGETLRISFQGKPLDVLVEQVEKTSSEKTTLHEDLANLTIDDWSDDELDVLDLVEDISARVYKVQQNSQIKCVFPNEMEKAGADNANRHTPPPPLQPAGLDSTLEELRSFLQIPLQHHKLFASRKLKPPKGVLLHGPSGVGKTLLAHKIASEVENVEFVSCASLQSKSSIVGQAERALTRYFRPSHTSKLLILDDVHLICPRRGGPGTTDRLASTLLALVDGIESDSFPLVLLATTSNPSLLDSALRRPGRLDTEIEVPLPDEPAARVAILKCQLESMNAHVSGLDNEDAWTALGKLAKGFNGADCMLAVKEAVRNAMLRGAIPQENQDGTMNDIELQLDDLTSAIRATKPSAIKSITVEIPQVKWESIGGMESVKRELREAIELPMTHEAVFKGLGVPAPRGILLYGPPGCSKTLMARALATEGHMNFLAVKGPELLSKWLGESERALASLFRRARMASPSIIFFDEIDAIATKRGSGDSASSGRMLSQLLTELDGVNHTGSAKGKKPHRVVVVGATNRPDLLDNALTRPGRIDRTIYVGVPDSPSREQIFAISLQGKSCANDIDIPHLAEDSISHGFSGAEIVAICRDAALLALEESNDPMAEETPKIAMKHLLQAVSGMRRQITPEMLAFYASYRESRKELFKA